MPKIKRNLIVRVMEALGFDAASSLSTGRLQKKINRIDRAIEFGSLIGDGDDKDELNEILEMIWDSFEAEEPIVVEEDRENVPAVKKTTDKRVPKFDSAGGKKAKYDWDVILGGGIVQLVQGDDFDCKASTFALQARSAAKRRGLKIRCKTEKGTVTIQAYSE